MTYQHIVVPISTPESEVAIEHAISLLQNSKGQLTLLTSTWNRLERTVPAPENYWEIKKKKADSKLQELAERLGVHGVTVQTMVTEQPLADALEEMEDEVDLVVMASSGKSGIKRWAYGSNTEQVVSRINTSVYVVQLKD